MIIRSADDIIETFDAINASKILGPMDKKHFGEVPVMSKIWILRPEECVSLSG